MEHPFNSTPTGSTTSKHEEPTPCSTIPVFLMALRKSRPLPSSPGSSKASISTVRLLIPNPQRTLMKCSTVWITTSPLPMEVQRGIPVSIWIFDGSTLRTGRPGRSVRIKLIPEFTGAGLHRILTLQPVCNPTPDRETSCLIVFCCSTIFLYFLLELFDPFGQIADRFNMIRDAA